jgi:hypothetical protein
LTTVAQTAAEQYLVGNGSTEPYFMLRTISVLRTRRFHNGGVLQITQYDILRCMSELLEPAIRRLRQLPEPMQESAARAVILQLDEEPEPGDREAVAVGREEFQRGDFAALDQPQLDIDRDAQPIADAV